MPQEKWDLLPAEAPVKQFERWMESCGNEELYDRKYRRIVEQQPKSDLFLSVIIRTQGKREEMLQDVLTSLQAQKDPDFEMIIICHRAEPEGVRGIREQIDRQPKGFRERIRVTETAEGERGAPVNLGLALARGQYAVCLDDDDLVFDHWVQAFHEAAKAHPGMILHAYALTQPWEQLMAPDGKTCLGLTTAGRADGKYCRPYRTLAQQYENYCPFMGIAFPLYLFRTFHLLLNEEITTTEDWDYLLRVAGIPGVWDIKEPTAIYRQWNTKETSHQMVSFEEWEENYKKNVRDQIRYPLLLNEDEAMECKKDLVGMQFSETKGRSSFMKDAVLFWSLNEHFSDDRHMRAPLRLEKGRMRVIFEMETKKGIQEATQLRFDPADETLFCLKDLTVTVYDRKRKATILKIADARETNGIIDGETILFLGEDPRVIYPLPEKIDITAIEVSAMVEYRCPPILEQWAAELGADSRWLSENRNKARLYLDAGEGVSEARMLERAPVYHGVNYEADFELPNGMREGLIRIRIDPTEAEMVWLDQLQIQVEYADGDTLRPTPSDYEELNGFLTMNGFACISRDPYLVIPLWGKAVRRVRVTGKIAFVNASKMEMLTADTVRVSSYQELFDQLAAAKKKENRW